MPHLLPHFTRALTRRPAPNFADGITESAHLGAPDYHKAMRQYDAYLEVLRECGLQVTCLPGDARFPDGHFVEDPFVIYRGLAFQCRSGAAARRGEGEALKAHLDDLRIVEAPPDARIDGGDVLFCADRALVGISARTNLAGWRALRAALRTVQPDIRVDAVPMRGMLHLKSGLTELAPGILIHCPLLQLDYDLAWARVIPLPPAEAHAADVMPVNETLVIAAGCPQALAAAKAVCARVITLDMSEFVKMDGGLTCLSLRY
ncbi:MAG: amidinotransferase [Chloroflexi bacterium]|nr:amidinotransferase [Chloroflexota bacterium]MCY3714877.1 amidinotransferase [Chloroflexota bacterium]MDE2649177.1 amidinotransferase [Chloroflexota bacterium]MXV92348.1 amidinotransferase [Chloroflexota bacterium]MYC54890.1 amidinotransferase [Chloroflexota bacterium]